MAYVYYMKNIFVLPLILVVSCAYLPSVKTDPGQVTVKVRAVFTDPEGGLYPCDPYLMDISIYDSEAHGGLVQGTHCNGDSVLEGEVTVPAGYYDLVGFYFGHEFYMGDMILVTSVTNQSFGYVFIEIDPAGLSDTSGRSYPVPTR